MTKKDYELIAETIRNIPRSTCQFPEIVASEFADALAPTNPHFDRSRFLDACMGRDSTDSAGRKVSYS